MKGYNIFKNKTIRGNPQTGPKGPSTYFVKHLNKSATNEEIYKINIYNLQILKKLHKINH